MPHPVPTAEFAGKVAFVTGGGSGIGAEIVRLLGQRGAQVMVTDLDQTSAADAAKQITDAGGIADSLGLDVTDPAAVATAVEATRKRFGRLDCCVNNAGVATPYLDIVDIPAEEWARQVEINLGGVFHCLQAQLRMMRDGDGGSIVNTASILGLLGMDHRAAYSAAKHGVVGLTKSAALDYATRGIRVNAVAPGYVDTPLLSDRSVQERADIASKHPVNRMATPTEVAESVLFLLGDRAGFTTGTILGVDGGYTAR